MSDNISSVIVDNSFLSTNDKPLEINGIYYVSREQYIIDETSENWKNGRIVIPKPIVLDSNSVAGNENGFIISIAKLAPRESTVVSWIGARLPKTSLLDNRSRFSYDDYTLNILKTNYLPEGSYSITDNEITIFTEDNKDIIPDLSSPVIVTILQPKKGEVSSTQTKKKGPKIFKIHDPRDKDSIKI